MAALDTQFPRGRGIRVTKTITMSCCVCSAEHTVTCEAYHETDHILMREGWGRIAKTNDVICPVCRNGRKELIDGR